MLEPDTELLLLLRVSKFRTLVGMLELAKLIEDIYEYTSFEPL